MLSVLYINIGIFLVIFISLIILIIWKNKIIKEKSKKIKIIKEIVDNIHNNLNLKNIQENSVQSIGNIFKADRCLIIEYDSNTENFSKVNIEFLSSPDLLSLQGDLPSVQASRITNICANNTILNISNIQKYIFDNHLQDTLIESFYQKYNIKSLLAIPIKHLEKVLGVIFLTYARTIKKFTPEDIDFLKGIADSIGVAICQSDLYEKQKNITKRDTILMQITEAIRINLDIKEMKQNIVDIICKTFNADRCYLREYNQLEELFLKPEAEYLASCEIESLKDKEPNQKALNYLLKKIMTQKEFIPLAISKDDFEKNILINNDLDEYFEESNIKSCFILPIVNKKGELTFLDLHYVKAKVILSDEDKELLTLLTKQILIALEQSILYAEAKIQNEREATIRKIVNIIRSSFEPNIIFTNVALELLNYFEDIQRVFITQNNFEKRDAFIEVTKNPDIKKVTDINETDYQIVSAYWENYIIANKTKKVINNIEKSDLPSAVKEIYKYMSVKSLIMIPINSKEKIKGGLYISSINNYKKWTEDEILFLESIINQLDIAIQQAELFETLKSKIHKETLLRKVSEATKKIPDIKAVKQEVVNQIGKAFKADRCYVRYYDKIKDISLKAEVEYRKSDDVISVMEVEPNTEGMRYFREQSKKLDKLFVIKDVDLYLEENNLQNSPVADYLNEINTKSDYPFVAWEDEKNVINIALHYTQKPHYLSQEEINFIDILTTQAGYVINQAELFEIQKKKVQREKTLRELINMIRHSLDINEIIHTFVFKTGEMLNAQRAFFSKYDKDLNTFLIPDEDSEYLMSAEQQSFRKYGKEFRQPYSFFVNELTLTKNTVFWSDTEKLIAQYGLENTIDAQNLREDKIRSGLLVPIIYEDNLFGIYVLLYEESNAIDQEAVNYMEGIAEQTSIGMNQSILFEKEKKFAQRELLLRKIIEIIRSSIDIDFIKHEIVNQIGFFLKADRVVLADYNFEKKEYYILENNEYRSSSDIKTFVGYDFSLVPGFSESIKETHLKGQDIIFNNLDKYLEEKNLKNSSVEKFYREMDFGSSMAINIYNGDMFFGNLVITFKERRYITQDDIKFIKTITNQASIAIYQSTLYQKEKQTAQRESVLRQITETIRSSLDIKQIKKSVVDSIGKALNADICLLVETNINTNKLGILDEYSEYRKSQDTASFIGMYFEQEPQIQFMTKMNKLEKDLFIDDSAKFIKENGLEESVEDEFFKRTKIKTAFGISLFYQNEFIGILGIYFINNVKSFSEEDRKFAKILAVQAGNALYQSKQYEFQRKIAFKEKVLKDIIYEIKFTRDVNNAYNKLLEKVADIFKLNRTLFLESSKINPDELDIKYEYVINNKDLSANNLIFPKLCIEQFLNLINNLEPLIIDDVAKCQPKEILGFFKKYKIQSLMSVPLVKYNGENKVLGFIVLCSETTRIWTEEEIDLIESISDSVVSVIWEISKFIETEELRNSFVLTLAHDFQVPLVGERTAIEYLLNYSDCSFGTNQDILKEILENNQNISALLDKFVDIYNYELGKKTLDFQIFNLVNILNEAILLSKIDTKLQNAKIILKPNKENYYINIDKHEILKVFSILINNAITYSDEKKEIRIEYYKKNNRIIISFHNDGKPIPPEIQEKLFNRYEMALAIERKIGAGTGLFLSKRIIEAHKGYIWFKTKKNTGTTFYVSLPLESKISPNI